MRISTTERQTFKRCRRKWDLASYNRQSLSPIVNAPALNLGTLVHATLADWTDDPTSNPQLIYKDKSQAMLGELIKVYTERVGCAPSVAELTPNLDAIQLGLAMIENYQAQWHSPLPPGFTLIANEQSLVVPIPGTEHCTTIVDGICRCNYCCGTAGLACEGPVSSSCEYCIELHYLECTFDGVMADAQGDWYIIERKTFGKTPSVDDLDNNDQFLAYQWALTQSLQTSGSNVQVVGLAYDGLLKKAKPTGVHNTLDKLFLRRVLLRGQHELAEFGEQLAWEAMQMADPDLKLYKTVPPVQGCQRWECQFVDLCHATSKGQPTSDLMKMFVKSDRKSHLDVIEES